METFDPGTIVIGGVSILVLLPGLVQFLKSAFKLEGETVTVLSFVLGAVLYVGSQAEALMPGAGKWVAFAVQGLSVGLSASGYYKLVTRIVDKLAGKTTYTTTVIGGPADWSKPPDA